MAAAAVAFDAAMVSTIVEVATYTATSNLLLARLPQYIAALAAMAAQVAAASRVAWATRAQRPQLQLQQFPKVGRPTVFRVASASMLSRQ